MFSEREKKVLKIMGRKKLTLSEISTRYFKGTARPLNGGIVISNTVRRIVEKCKYYKLEWRLEKFRINSKLYIKRTKV